MWKFLNLNLVKMIKLVFFLLLLMKFWGICLVVMVKVVLFLCLGIFSGFMFIGIFLKNIKMFFVVKGDSNWFYGFMM